MTNNHEVNLPGLNIPHQRQELDDRILARLDPQPPEQSKPLLDVVVLIPAHNEEVWIERTVLSLLAQTHPVKRVLVMADNCTDRTVELARAAGAEVHETVDNRARKAGAINQAFEMLSPTLRDDDVLMTMDADGELMPDCIENALKALEERVGDRVGGVCAAAVSRPQSNFLEAAQAIEYHKSRRIVARRAGRVFVLSGCASFFPVRVLKEVAAERGRRLPGIRGKLTLEGSLVEDYELTLAVKQLGYTCVASSACNVMTDLMPTIDEFEAQRLRWIRGTFETLHLYGWGPHTRRTFVTLGFNMFTALVLAAAVLALVFGWLAYGGIPEWRFLLLTPLFMAENVMSAHRLGTWRAKVMAWSFFPMWAYDLAQAVVYWRSFFWAMTSRKQEW